MAEIVNLRLARKRKARDAAAEAAGEARAKHGRSKAEKTLDRSRREKAERDVEAHRLEGPAIDPGFGPRPVPATVPASGAATAPLRGWSPDTTSASGVLRVRDTGDSKPD
jgi:hypothetical protein